MLISDILPTWILLCRFVGSLGSLPLPDSSSASQHLLLFISALIPKALASLLTSFTLVLAGNQQVGRRSSLLFFVFSFHICERRLKLTSLRLCVRGGGVKARRRALEEPEYLRGVLLEVQRLWPPFIGGRRLADQVSSSSVFIPR